MGTIRQESERGPVEVRTPSGVTALTPEVAQILAELASATVYRPGSIRRVDPGAQAASPMDLVLDRLEESMSFDASHEWVLTPHAALGTERPIEAITSGRTKEVLRLIELEFRDG